MGPKWLRIFCVAALIAACRCVEKTSDDSQRERLPEFLSELDVANLEASDEDIESLKKVVKRLTPATNGEYLIYQGVMGQPGVDFPVLTTIPTTSFSCRGLKGGYYADLETNCQVFHICDNGRKISFLCPNGTIFQQSQLICDWWFKVDCGKSEGHYEQSAEQLAQENRKRSESKRINSEYHRSSDTSNSPGYYQTQNQNVDYDGKQNARSNPFARAVGNNEGYGANNEGQSNNQYQQNARGGNQFSQNQQNTTSNQNYKNTYNQNYNQNYNENPRESQNSNNYASTQGQRSTYSEKQVTGENGTARQNQSQGNQNYNGYGVNSRQGKSFRDFRTTSEVRPSLNSQTTTASPFKEYQEPAESAAFATSRGNRYNKFQYNQFNGYYRETPSVPVGTPLQKFATGSTWSGYTTIAPASNGRNTNFEAGTVPTTQKSYVNTDFYRQNTVTQASSLDGAATTSWSTAGNADGNPGVNANRNNNGGYYSRENGYPSTQRPYVNTDTYRRGEGSTTWPSWEQTTVTPSTPKPYVNTETYRQNGVTLTTERSTEGYEGNTVTASTNDANTQTWNTQTGATGKSETKTSYASRGRTGKSFSDTGSGYLDNAIKSSTERYFGGPESYQENSVTNRNLSPYDTSFTYKYGKITSTLGPYIPFTKNYAYTTTSSTTTQKPPVYTATVPTIPSSKKVTPTQYPQYPTTETPARYESAKHTFDDRPAIEKQHAIGMIHSLQELEESSSRSSNKESDSITGGGLYQNSFQDSNRNDLDIPPSSGPSTLHSLALYFATANDNFDSNETVTDVAVRLRAMDVTATPETDPTTENAVNAELPTSLLTRNTVKSYTELFNIKVEDAELANNISTETRLGKSEETLDQNNDDDLDLQQSQGPVTGLQKKNDPKLRELAQVFTHALSAYLQDPDTFRKVLTEIRPTEPPVPSSTDFTETTTFLPTTQDDYPSATKEKDEVLDFSDVTKAAKRRQPTTPYPTTYSTDTTYYTTPQPQLTSTPSTLNYVDESLNEAQTSDLRTRTENGANNIAAEVNHAFDPSTNNHLQSYNFGTTGSGEFSRPNDFTETSDFTAPNVFTGPLSDFTAPDDAFAGVRNDFTGPSAFTEILNDFTAPTAVTGSTAFAESNDFTGSTGSGNDFDSYFPTGSDSSPNQFNNNKTVNREPYGKGLRPETAVPIINNYQPSTTRASYLPMRPSTQIPRQASFAGENQQRDSTSLNYRDVTTDQSTFSAATTDLAPSTQPPTTTTSFSQESEPTTTKEPFIINYIDASPPNPHNYNPDSFVTVHTTYSDVVKPNDASHYEDVSTNPTAETTSDPVTSTQALESTVKNSQPPIDHWTASPTVTKLWETTIFLDPKHINNGLTHDSDTNKDVEDNVSANSYSTTPATRLETLVTDASGIGLTTTYQSTESPNNWNWQPNDNDDDAPTAFTLLPTVLSAGNAATPLPNYTTRSSITTTITSSLTASSDPSPQERSNFVRSTFESSVQSSVSSNAATFNVTENEITKAHEMFGSLNATSTNTLMDVMKQADNNSTVRQLVLLLISRCKGPMNETVQEEKDQLLNALLKMPVNQFSTEESRQLITEINNAEIRAIEPVTTTTTTSPVVTTYRNRRGRKFRSTTVKPTPLTRRSDDVDRKDSLNSLESTSDSDTRALELLRSLYSIAAKWG